MSLAVRFASPGELPPDEEPLPVAAVDPLPDVLPLPDELPLVEVVLDLT